MKKFKFKYENILKMRINEESKIKILIANLNIELMKLETKRDNILTNRIKYFKEIQEQLQNGCQASVLLEIERNKKYYVDSLKDVEFKIETILFELKKAREEYVEILKEKKIMEKLKEKKEKLFLKEIEKMENKLIDEIVNYKNSK
ncbi:flagellar FliJ family protein [Helicovermis profundi]|uniref:Flagellar FliJ protein n=1 Tax=Helicovermis profundi TaxID=3065157 RepID=A0AAU9E4M7_9FIRM|nr:hypothetical protein HLPR_17090 [Clostridia bacterium S502]